MPKLTQAEIKKHFYYDSLTGAFAERHHGQFYYGLRNAGLDLV